MRLRFTCFFATALLLVSSITVADVLLLDAIAESPVNSTEGIPRPSRGMTMDQVKGRFGEPPASYPRVGDPPITRWDYPEYSVFFEYQHVLTSVVHQR
ncbi:MAG: hypothetical protein ABFR65_07535 [Pseudomonadota bacterium]